LLNVSQGVFVPLKIIPSDFLYEYFPQHFPRPRNPGLYRSDRTIQNLGNFLIGELFNFSQNNDGTQFFRQLCQGKFNGFSCLF